MRNNQDIIEFFSYHRGWIFAASTLRAKQRIGLFFVFPGQAQVLIQVHGAWFLVGKMSITL